MRRWELTGLGEPIDRLALVEVDPPTPGPDEVLVDVAAVGLSFPDVLMCRGEYQAPTPDRFCPGGETAGTVRAVGADVTDVAVGDRIVAIGGGTAEQVVLPARSVFRLPDGVGFDTAAALPVNYGTTWYALHDRGRIAAGDKVLVTGAAGGTGSAAVELAKAAGAWVIGVAGGATKAEAVRSLGADEVIDHHETPEFVDRVRELSGGGVDVAYDPVGGSTFHQVRRCMAWDGRLLVIGFVAGIPDIPANHVLLKSYSVIGVHWGASLGRDPGSLRRQLGAVLELAAEGRIAPLVFPPYDLADGARALQDLADRRVHGKVVVRPGGPVDP